MMKSQRTDIEKKQHGERMGTDEIIKQNERINSNFKDFPRKTASDVLCDKYLI